MTPNTKPFKPMLAAAVKDVDDLEYPYIATPKIDGIRALLRGGRLVSRTLKPIPNHHIRETLEAVLPEGADGELLVGESFQQATSGIMSHKGEPDFTFWMFDIVSAAPYMDRLCHLDLWKSEEPRDPRVRLLPYLVVHTPEDLLAFEAECLDAGFEGCCLRKPDSPYKHGRSTLKQGWLLKLKRFVDAEAVILGLDEQMRNTNTLETDELGYAKRSKTKAGVEGKGTLGRFRMKDLATGVEFAIGTGVGLTDALRKEIWQSRDRMVGRIVKYKKQPHGEKNAPRLPIFLGFRDPQDL